MNHEAIEKGGQNKIHEVEHVLSEREKEKKKVANDQRAQPLAALRLY